MSKASEYAANYQAHSLKVLDDHEAVILTTGGVMLHRIGYGPSFTLEPEQALVLGNWLVEMFGEDNK